MGKPNAAVNRSKKWQRRMLNYISLAGERGLTFRELRGTRKMANIDASDEWVRKRLERLEDKALIWYDPSEKRYKPTRADASRAPARPPHLTVGSE